jgi:hypothetical protein
LTQRQQIFVAFRYTLVLLNGRRLHSTVHGVEYITNCNHSAIHRGGEYND